MVDLVVVGGLCATPQAPGEELQLVLLEAVREGVVDVELGLEGDVGGLDDSAEALVRMRRLKLWEARTEEMLLKRLEKLQGASAEQEFQYKKILSISLGTPVDKVDKVCHLLLDIPAGEDY